MHTLTFELAVAVLVLAGAATFTAALLALVQGSLTAAIAATSLCIGIVLGLLSLRACRASGPELSPGRWEWATLLLFALVAARHFLWIVFERSGVLYTPNAYNYGDLPLHWTYIQYFANAAPFWPENPICTGARLQYPVGIDLFNALLVKLGLSQETALRGVGLAASTALCVTLFQWGRGFAIAALLLSGGLPWLGEPFGLPAAESAWKNLFLALFVPQRGFLFALPAGLLLLWSWRERLLRRQRGLPVWVEGVLWGTMPLFHLHTFLFVSIVIVVWAIVSRRWRDAAASLAWAFLPAAWCAFEVTDGFRSASLVLWKPGWVIGPADPLVFLLVNFTLFLPLFLWAGYRGLRARDVEGMATILLALALFASLFFVMLAPWEWDNTKIMIWCYLLALPASARLTIERFPLAARALALFALLAPGAVAIAASMRPDHAYEVLDRSEEKAVCEGLAGLPVTERVATVQTFNHPVALCGHPLVAGYSGHLWSHGIRAKAVEDALRSLMMGETGWDEEAKALRARYLFWGRREDAAFVGSSRPWEQTRRQVWESASGRLYDLAPQDAEARSSPDPSGATARRRAFRMTTGRTEATIAPPRTAF